MRVAAALIAAGLMPAFAVAQPLGAPLEAAASTVQTLNAVVFSRPPPAKAAFALPAKAATAFTPQTPSWTPALVLGAGDAGVSLSPHAALSGDQFGRMAEAGFTAQIGSLKDVVQSRLKALGVKDGAAAYGDQGRFYLFAAVRGQAVGMNLVSGSGGLRRDGWSTDTSSALVGDGQVGLGWRKGGMEADLGYVHRGVHIRNAPRGVSDSYADDMAALSFTLRPSW